MSIIRLCYDLIQYLIMIFLTMRAITILFQLHLFLLFFTILDFSFIVIGKNLYIIIDSIREMGV